MREDNSALGRTYLYAYNAGGNLVSQNVYLYNATSGYGNYQYSRSYSYGNDWSDQLTSYNGSSISYDNAGNPTTYLGTTMSWTRGRLLSSYKASGATYATTCSYNADGIRYRKFTTVSNYVGRTVNYTLNGTTILQETRTTAGPSSSSTDTLKYMYTHTGLVGVVYNGTEYYYLHNLQGDIVAIQNSTGNTVAQYTYDAWGNHTVCDGDGNDISSDGTSIANINPFRYRGYYYDTDLDLYYLNSRYYDPNTGKFINADTVDCLDTERINGLNLYVYSLNNPVTYGIDSHGEIFANTQPGHRKVNAWIAYGLGAVPDIITLVKYSRASGIHTKFLYSTTSRIMFPKLGSTWRYIQQSSANYASVTSASFKSIIARDSRAGCSALAKSFGLTVLLHGCINLVINIYENDYTSIGDLILDTAIDTAIGVGSYYLAVGTMSFIAGGLALVGVALPGVVVFAGVVLLSIGFDWCIRKIFGLDY